METRDQTRDIFDIIATYFVNTYWFPLYKHAFDAFSERQFSNIEEAYKVMIDRYRVAFCVTQDSQGRENPNYSKIIVDLQNNYNTWLNNNLSLGDFIDIVCRQIIPIDVYKSLGRQDNRKDDLFRKTITQSVTNFTVYVATIGLADVIKGRAAGAAKQRMAAWKDEFIKILYTERDILYGRFMATKSGVDPNKQKNNQISREAFDRMLAKIKQLIEEKAKIQKELNIFVFAAKKQHETDTAKIAELTALLAGANAGPVRPAPRRPAALPTVEEVEEVSSEEESSVEQSAPKLERINDPSKDDFLKKKAVGVGSSDITKPLDDVESYSGDDFVERGPPPKETEEETESSSEMSADE